MLYPYTAHNAYWAKIIKQDMAKGRTAQRACNDVFAAIMMMGRFTVNEAMNLTSQAAYHADLKLSEIKW